MDDRRRKKKKEEEDGRRGSCRGENYLPLLLCENVTPIFFQLRSYLI